MHPTQYFRLFQYVCKLLGVKSSSAMKVNAWLCTCADLESGLSKNMDVGVPKTVNYP